MKHTPSNTSKLSYLEQYDHETTQSSSMANYRHQMTIIILWDELIERFTKGNNFQFFGLVQEIHSSKQGECYVSKYYTDLKIAWEDVEDLRLQILKVLSLVTQQDAHPHCAHTPPKNTKVLFYRKLGSGSAFQQNTQFSSFTQIQIKNI